jgi:hypothetical protein
VVSVIASVISSIAAWGVSALMSGHVSDTTDFVVSFVVGSVVFVPSFIYVKRLRDGM